MSFYNTQGRKYDLPPVSSGSLNASLFVPGSWANSVAGYVRTEMWATMFDEADVPSAYPVIGYTNYGGAARFRGYPETGVWQDLAVPVLCDQWNDLSIEFTGTTFNFSVKGDGVFSELDANGTIKFGNGMIQAYNFGQGSGSNDGPNYSANWSNTSEVPEPSTVLVAGAGLAALLLLRRR